MGVRFSRGVFMATYLNGREPGSDPGSGSSTLPVAVLGFGVMVSIEVFEASDMSSNLVIPVSSRGLMVVISGSQPEDARSSRVGSIMPHVRVVRERS